MKTKIKSHGNKVTDFYDKKIPKLNWKVFWKCKKNYLWRKYKKFFNIELKCSISGNIRNFFRDGSFGFLDSSREVRQVALRTTAISLLCLFVKDFSILLNFSFHNCWNISRKQGATKGILRKQLFLLKIGFTKRSHNTSHKFWDQSLSPHYQFCFQVSKTGSCHKLWCS